MHILKTNKIYVQHQQVGSIFIIVCSYNNPLLIMSSSEYSNSCKNKQ